MEVSKLEGALTLAEGYLEKLNLLKDGVHNAKNQVQTSASDAQKAVLQQFEAIRNIADRIITERQNELIEKILKSEVEGLEPLASCESFVVKKNDKVLDLIKSIKEVMSNARAPDQKTIKKLINRAEGLGPIPDHPALKEVPFISFEYYGNIESELIEVFADYGVVTAIAPVQIKSVYEKPGAILVEWHVVDLEERFVDIQEFCLQSAEGDSSSTKLNFKTCYQGMETKFLVKDLSVGEKYSFRVSGRYEGSQQLSRWSVPQTCETNLQPYSWRENGCFAMIDNNRMAKPLVFPVALLFSDGAQIKPGYTMEFTVLEKDDKLAHMGLVTTDEIECLTAIPCSQRCIVVSSNGDVRVDGIKKATYLPKVNKGSKITFSCEWTCSRIFVHVDLCEKRVSYECGADPDISFYFVAQLPTIHWKVMVE